jgi:hypothetical protein
MTTSSNNQTPSLVRPEAKNWHELSSLMTAHATEKFADWIDAQLVIMEESQKRFVTRQAVAKSLRR